MLAAALPHGVTAVHVGTLSLVMEPIASAIERLITDGLPPDALVMVDPNCRPAAIGDRDAYLDRFERILHRADVVKVSVEDLDYLCPGVPAEVAATTLLGDRPALVLVTDGPRPARAFLSGGFGGAGGEVSVEVPRVEVVDTIGAGDAFGGGFLAWWSGAGLGRKELSSAEPVRRGASRRRRGVGADLHQERGGAAAAQRACRCFRLVGERGRRLAWTTRRAPRHRSFSILTARLSTASTST